MCWNTDRCEGFALEAPAGRTVTAQGGKFPLDQLPDTAKAEYLLSRSPWAPQVSSGWCFKEEINPFISHFPCLEHDTTTPITQRWLLWGYSKVTPGSRTKLGLFVREGKVVFALSASPRESAKSCHFPRAPSAPSRQAGNFVWSWNSRKKKNNPPPKKNPWGPTNRLTGIIIQLFLRMYK